MCEVSSFQAEQLGHFRADALLWTNFAEDHLERHAAMEAYFAAKWELVVRTPADRFFAGSSVQRFAARFGRPLPPRAPVATEGQRADARLDGTPFAFYPQRENFILAAAWWRSEGLDEAGLYAAARAFRVGRHRLSRVAEIDGVTYWNDSKATNFHAVEAALAGLRGARRAHRRGPLEGGRPRRASSAGSPRASRTPCSSARPARRSPRRSTTCGVPHAVCDTLEDAVRARRGGRPAGGERAAQPGLLQL